MSTSPGTVAAPSAPPPDLPAATPEVLAWQQEMMRAADLFAGDPMTALLRLRTLVNQDRPAGGLLTAAFRKQHLLLAQHALAWQPVATLVGLPSEERERWSTQWREIDEIDTTQRTAAAQSGKRRWMQAVAAARAADPQASMQQIAASLHAQNIAPGGTTLPVPEERGEDRVLFAIRRIVEHGGDPEAILACAQPGMSPAAACARGIVALHLRASEAEVQDPRFDWSRTRTLLALRGAPALPDSWFTPGGLLAP